MRLSADGSTVALLHYPRFFDDPFPALRERWLVDLERGSAAYRTYVDSLNPPILHRKELMLPLDDAHRAAFADLTAAAEMIGLFDEPKRIGYRRQWQQLIHERGYRLDGHRLVPLGNDDGDQSGSVADAGSLHAQWRAARQRTALVRYGFSAPIQSLARHGFLDGRYRLFDYGCGRGDDVRGLRENGLDASGWDPFYAPDDPIVSADLVNLGFVINVIEDFDERLEALIKAWSLAGTLLVVSVMLANQNEPRGQRFRDGVMTQRGTFQRYYSQGEIKAFLEQALDEEAIPVASGVLYVFRDKDEEQRFFIERSRGRRNLLIDPSLPVRERPRRERRDRAAERYAEHQGALERLWEQWLSLGRRPDRSEVEDQLGLIDAFGSIGKALRFVESRKAADSSAEELARKLEQSRTSRAQDLTVYFALDQFERRKPYKHLEPVLKRDIKHFFGDYGSARTAGLELLMQIADTAAIERACREAAEHGLGWLETGADAALGEGENALAKDAQQRAVSLQLHADLVEQLPPLLRTYVGAAAAAYGDYRSADLIKIHVGSGKLTLMRFDDFDGKPLPRMLERVKIKLRDQDVEYYAYGEEYQPPFLYRKSRFINEEHPRYPEQLAFEETLEGLDFLDLSGYGPPPGELLAQLQRHRWEVFGDELRRSRTIPDLDAPCGRYFTFRQLIECGETQAQTALPNLPRQPESYNALLDLAEQVLDPVVDWFGMIRLTYGFCSPELARKIPGRIDPRRDQHAAHERNRIGNPICKRLGAAVDFIVEDENMLEVAQWVVVNTGFDRLYFYGEALPIHVSYGPGQSRTIVQMKPTRDGKRIPRVVRLDELLLRMRSSAKASHGEPRPKWVR